MIHQNNSWFLKVILIHQNNFTIGKTKKGEIDFIALKDNKPKYIQVSLYLENKSTINREFGAFFNIDDNFEKYVISLDKENKSQKGIIHLNAIDFLLKEDF